MYVQLYKEMNFADELKKDGLIYLWCDSSDTSGFGGQKGWGLTFPWVEELKDYRK
jgi:hypothetical protein